MTPEFFAELELKCNRIMQQLGCKDYDECISKLKEIENKKLGVLDNGRIRREKSNNILQ